VGGFDADEQESVVLVAIAQAASKYSPDEGFGLPSSVGSTIAPLQPKPVGIGYPVQPSISNDPGLCACLGLEAHHGLPDAIEAGLSSRTVVRSRPMGDRHAQSPRGILVWSDSDPDRAPARRSP
jgi:hypothetical protein